MAAIAKLDALDGETADALYGITVATRDSTVRFLNFQQLVRLADVAYQDRLMDVAVAPGNAEVGRAGPMHLLFSASMWCPRWLRK